MWNLILPFVFLISVVFCPYRNYWVYKTRMKLLDENYEKYKQLPSYHFMFWHFWIFNVDSFLDSMKSRDKENSI